jgi:hypothetical protein
VSLLSQQLIFKSEENLNEIDLINRIHAMRDCAKKLNISGVITYRANLFATQHEGYAAKLDNFVDFLSQNYHIIYKNSIQITSRRYTNIHLNYVGDNVPIVNDPLIDWGIDDPKLPFPHELMTKLLSLTRSNSFNL